MNRISVLAAVVTMLENGYESPNVAAILRDVANTFSPIPYNGTSLPKNDDELHVFVQNVKAAWPTANGCQYPQKVERNMHMIPIIKAMRQISGCGLKEAKELLEVNFDAFK